MLNLFLSFIEDEEEQSKFAELYNVYRNQMYWVAFKYLGDENDAEDAVQNAFMRIARNMKSIDDVQSDQARLYVLTAAKNAALDLKRDFYYRFNFADIYEVNMADEENLLSGVIEEENKEFVKQCIRELDDIYRDVLQLYFYQELKAEEIAKVLGRKVDTVRKQITRGKSLLAKKLYSKVGDDEPDGKKSNIKEGIF